jgi:hypothetical protein
VLASSEDATGLPLVAEARKVLALYIGSLMHPVD